jgi:hypothetical protein
MQRSIGWHILSVLFAIHTSQAGPWNESALTVTSATPYKAQSPTLIEGPHGIEAFVRLRTDANPRAYAIFSVDPGFWLKLSAKNDSEVVQCETGEGDKYLHDVAELSKSLDWNSPAAFRFDYQLRAYPQLLPIWPADFYALVAKDMLALPDHNEKWLAVRIDIEDGCVRFWVDDRLVGVKHARHIKPGGFHRVELSTGVQLADYRASKLESTPGFLPIRLSGHVNARGFADPPRGSTTVDSIPFLIPGENVEGNDHIDVGLSLYRQANAEGYAPAYVFGWTGSQHRDPRRIQLRVPNGRYDTLYLLAAADNDRDEIPLVTAAFFRPEAGFPVAFETEVPLATAKNATARSIPVTLRNGRKANLWLVKIPLDPGQLSSFADLDVIEIELTKKLYQYRDYPDPIRYGWHQGGRASAVHVYAATLGEAPVAFGWQPDKFGHVWVASEAPGYTATLTNRTSAGQRGRFTVTTRSHDGTEQTKQEQAVTVASGGTATARFDVPVKLFGYHDITATLEIAGKFWTEKRSFVKLAPDRRAPRWTEGKGALFGFWSYFGKHHTPRGDHHANLMTAAGARTSIAPPNTTNALVNAHWSPVSGGAWAVKPQVWAKAETFDPKLCADYQRAVSESVAEQQSVAPAFRPDHVYLFPEPHISTRLTAGNIPEYWGEPPFAYTDEEKENLRMMMVTARCAAEAVRRKWPDLKILIPWGDPLFVWPLLRAGFPKELIDGSGLDVPGFERLPEQQLHQISLHRMYLLKKEYARAGIPDPVLQYCEGPFVPTEVGACSWREQMDIYHRWTLLNMAYGVKRFYSGWFAFDCGGWYGAEHYGGCGIQRRIPYCDPKPAYAAFATMTAKLDQANFDGWLKTGSLTTYCLRFKGPNGIVYALWTLRGRRPVTLTFTADNEIEVTDSMGNSRTHSGRQVTVTTDPSVIYVTGGEVQSIEVGTPDHSDAQPAPGAAPIADLGDGSWRFTSERDMLYEKNNFDTYRYPGKFSATLSDGVLISKLEKQTTVREVMPWYSVLKPRRPVTLAGAPSHIGLWVKGASDWGRVVYCLRDAKGERWTSVGTKDQWNCDDVHSRSSLNFDGWRYLRFELPGHLGYDNFRKHGTTWWGSHGGDGVVDLPLRLESIIVEQRTHVLYVNDAQPAAADTVAFGKLHVEYAAPEDSSAEAVRISRLRMPVPKDLPALPNPIAEMAGAGVGAPSAIAKLETPLAWPDGSHTYVHFREVPGAKRYFVWVGAHKDGRGAINMTKEGVAGMSQFDGRQYGAHVSNLKPGMPLYFWVTYEDAQGRSSKPSSALAAVLQDMFKEK